MDTRQILTELRRERDRLDQAIAASNPSILLAEVCAAADRWKRKPVLQNRGRAAV